MFEKSVMLYLYVETSLHAGSGTGLGVVDLPIQRERVTGYPLVQSSGIKGKLRAEAALIRGDKDAQLMAVFGPDTKGSSEYAGAISPGDARLLLFPVRSLLGVFAWTTSRDILARFVRDVAACTPTNLLSWDVPQIGESEAMVAPGNDIVADGNLVLEEFAFAARENGIVKTIATWLQDHALPDGTDYQYWKDKLPRSLVILPENAFRDFTQFSTEVVSRIKLNPETKTVEHGALWTEEHLPTDTLLYAPVHATKPRKKNVLLSDTADEVIRFVTGLHLDRVQLGGDETTGRGLVRLRWELEE